MRKFIITLTGVLLALSLNGQELGDTLTLYFHRASSVIDKSYNTNGERSEEFFSRVRSMQGVLEVQMVTISLVGTASPEGTYNYNQKLSERRKEAVISYLRQNIDASEIRFHANSLVEDWAIVADLVSHDTDMPLREEVLNVINSFHDEEDFETEIITELKKIGSGSAYEYLHSHIFPQLRSCKVIAIYDMTPFFDDEIVIEEEEISVPRHIFSGLSTTDSLSVAPIALKTFNPFIKIKTNTIGLALGHANVAAEYAFAEHWSVALPFYYSGGFDYFKPTIKFRGIVLQPEARYYLKGNEGFYVGAHLGLGWYNFALDGEYRVQDHRGRRPAWGGGLGLGYTTQFKKNPRWGMEFAIGAGVYDVKYDTFYNEPNGAYAEHGVHNTFFGIDNAAVSFTYKFDNLKKEGRK